MLKNNALCITGHESRTSGQVIRGQLRGKAVGRRFHMGSIQEGPGDGGLMARGLLHSSAPRAYTSLSCLLPRPTPSHPAGCIPPLASSPREDVNLLYIAALRVFPKLISDRFVLFSKAFRGSPLLRGGPSPSS